jgi:serine phosphatase RsbU (regulator of sigma subunit)
MDASNMNGEQYGYGRLHQFLEANQSLSVDELVSKLAYDVAYWSGNAPAFDDLTLLALEVTDDGQIPAAT